MSDRIYGCQFAATQSMQTARYVRATGMVYFVFSLREFACWYHSLAAEAYHLECLAIRTKNEGLVWNRVDNVPECFSGCFMSGGCYFSRHVVLFEQILEYRAVIYEAGKVVENRNREKHALPSGEISVRVSV